MNIDRDGFLIDSSDWTEMICNELIEKDGYKLTEKRWSFIQDARVAYKTKRPPTSGAGLAKAYNTTEADILKMFPKTPITFLCRWGGLTKPNNIGAV